MVSIDQCEGAQFAHTHIARGSQSFSPLCENTQLCVGEPVSEKEGERERGRKRTEVLISHPQRESLRTQFRSEQDFLKRKGKQNIL